MINHHTFAFRNSMILIAAIVILISLLVGAVAYPLILPAKSQSFTRKNSASSSSLRFSSPSTSSGLRQRIHGNGPS